MRMGQDSTSPGNPAPQFRSHISSSRSPAPPPQNQNTSHPFQQLWRFPSSSPESTDAGPSLFRGGDDAITPTQWQCGLPKYTLNESPSNLTIGTGGHEINFAIQNHNEQHTERGYSGAQGSAPEEGNTCSRQVSASPSEDSVAFNGIPSSALAKYGLRPAARHGNSTTVLSTWLDQDESGTYDPSTERKRMLSNISKKRKICLSVPKDHNGDGLPGKRAKPSSWEMAQRIGYDLVATITFKTPAGLEWLRAHKSMDNWPEGSHNSIAELGIEIPDEHTFQRYLRSKKLENMRNEQPVIPDPALEQDDLFGHPAARGCIPCRKTGVDCPLARDDGDEMWPCGICTSAGIDCELLMSPMTKQACESCKRSGFVCSYLDNEANFEQACDDCFSAGEKCVAGPYPGTMPQRISLKKWHETGKLPPPNHITGPLRKYVACTACRQERKSCSLKSKFDPPPCKLCSTRKIACTFEEVIKTSRGKQPAVTGIGQEDDDDAGTLFVPEVSDDPDLNNAPNPSQCYMTDSQGHFGPVVTLRTSFSHPIHFNYVPNLSKHTNIDISSSNPTTQCHFCLSPNFGVLGWGEPKSVLAIRWTSGTGYTELLFGYVAERCPQTLMCPACTQARVDIIACGRHVLEPVPACAALLRDPAAAEQAACRLLAGIPRNEDRWCAVCMAAASHRCAKGATRGAAGESGCGLLLCGDCAKMLGATFGGDFEAFAKSMEENFLGEVSNARDDVRADVGFLRRDGLLMRNAIGK